MMSWYNKVYPVLLWSLFLLSSGGSQNVTLTEDRGSNIRINTAETPGLGGAITVVVNTSEATTMTNLGPALSPSGTPSGTATSPLPTDQPTFDVSSTTGLSSTPGPSSSIVSSSTPGPISSNVSSSTPGPSFTNGSSSTPGPSFTNGSSSTPGPSSSIVSSSTPGPISSNVSSSTPGPSFTNVSSSTPGPISSIVSSSTPGPISSIVSSSTPGPSFTNVSSSTPGPSSSNVSSSTPGPSFTNVSSSTNETFSTTSPPIFTTDNSTSPSSGVLIPKTKTKKVPILTTKTTTTMTTSPSKKDMGGGLPCSPTRRDGLVSQCLIAIASLAAVATFFMVSCIILCTKYSSRKHRYRVDTNHQSTEMVCISALLHNDNGPHCRPYIPKSNGILLHGTELDSDEEGGDDVTLHSFLPDNEQRPESRV